MSTFNTRKFFEITALSTLLLFTSCKENARSMNGSPDDSFNPGTFTDPATQLGSGGETGIITPPREGGNDHGTIPTSNLFCGETGQIVLSSGQTTVLRWSYENGYVPPTPLQFTLRTSAVGYTSLGTVTSQSTLSASYQAPATIPVDFEVEVVANLENQTFPSVCTIRLLKDGGIGVIDDGQTRGLVGSVYSLAPDTSRLPNLAMLTPILEIVAPNLDIPTRAFSDGFPSVPDLFEWFAIRFRGRLIVPATGSYQFQLMSDDGANFYIDNELVVDNDGVHAPRSAYGTVSLTQGNHPVQIDYFQGPRYHIALQLLWRRPGEIAYEIIPPDNFLRPQ